MPDRQDARSAACTPPRWWKRSRSVDPDAVEVVKLLPSSPPVRGERVLVRGFPCRVTRVRVKWDGYHWTIKKLRVKEEPRVSG